MKKYISMHDDALHAIFGAAFIAPLKYYTTKDLAGNNFARDYLVINDEASLFDGDNCVLEVELAQNDENILGRQYKTIIPICTIQKIWFSNENQRRNLIRDVNLSDAFLDENLCEVNLNLKHSIKPDLQILPPRNDLECKIANFDRYLGGLALARFDERGLMNGDFRDLWLYFSQKYPNPNVDKIIKEFANFDAKNASETLRGNPQISKNIAGDFSLKQNPDLDWFEYAKVCACKICETKTAVSQVEPVKDVIGALLEKPLDGASAAKLLFAVGYFVGYKSLPLKIEILSANANKKIKFEKTLKNPFIEAAFNQAFETKIVSNLNNISSDEEFLSRVFSGEDYAKFLYLNNKTQLALMGVLKKVQKDFKYRDNVILELENRVKNLEKPSESAKRYGASVSNVQSGNSLFGEQLKVQTPKIADFSQLTQIVEEFEFEDKNQIEELRKILTKKVKTLK